MNIKYLKPRSSLVSLQLFVCTCLFVLVFDVVHWTSFPHTTTILRFCPQSCSIQGLRHCKFTLGVAKPLRLSHFPRLSPSFHTRPPPRVNFQDSGLSHLLIVSGLLIFPPSTHSSGLRTRLRPGTFPKIRCNSWNLKIEFTQPVMSSQASSTFYDRLSTENFHWRRWHTSYVKSALSILRNVTVTLYYYWIWSVPVTSTSSSVEVLDPYPTTAVFSQAFSPLHKSYWDPKDSSTSMVNNSSPCLTLPPRTCVVCSMEGSKRRLM